MSQFTFAAMPEKAGFPQFTALLKTPELPGLGPGPRPQVRPLGDLKQDLEDFLKSTGLPSTNQDLIRAIVLLWHDHLDSAHTISQEIQSADGSYVHGIMHRREPDYGNAAYWFRRVGKHPCFVALAKRAGALLQKDAPLAAELICQGEWNPYGFIDACKQAAQRPASNSRTELLRTIQGIEFELLLERVCHSSSS